MASKMSCFSFLLSGNEKRSKVVRSKVAYAKKAPGNDCPPKVMPVEFMDMADTVDVNQGSGGVHAAARDTNTSVHTVTAAESARRERDADQDEASTNRDSFDVSGEDESSSGYTSGNSSSSNKNAVTASSVGRVSPPASPELKRSCSNIETARSVPVPEEFELPEKSRSYGDLKALRSGRPMMTTTTPSGGESPAAWSVRTSCSADRIMLKKRSASQVLPSRSRKLWWRLFLWSHRNLHRPAAASSATPARPSAGTHGGAAHRNGGYTSDTLDSVAMAATAREPKDKEVVVEEEEDPILPNHQWVAFSSLDRVSAWVNSLGHGSSFHVVEEEEEEEEDVTEHGGAVRAAWCSEIVECSTAAAEKQHARARRRAAEQAVQSSSVVRTLNVVSSVAHISGMGLQAVPMIAAFSSLRAVNLSGNLLIHVHPGSLPKGLRSLDLSRNKIASIEGLRELTRLRVLNLSYNRISRIGHGLSSCTAIRELYLAGNKISDVDGLHRLLKLAVLDVGFNKITTTKSLGQLVANYASLRALNLVGNPVQANVGDETLRKAVAGLLPRVEYLNKQAVKPQRAREVAKDSVAQAALGNGGGWGARSRRVRHQSPGSSGKGKSRGSRSRSKTSRARR